MINTFGALAVLDRGITINWEDGATLHKIGAQVRYRTRESTASQLLRVSAGKRLSDDPLALIGADALLRATWTWREAGDGWAAQLAVLNTADHDLLIDSIDVIRIDSAFGGLFNLGAPPGLWRCAFEREGDPVWESYGDSAASANGFLRATRMLMQPSVSNRSSPPAVLIRALNAPVAPAPDVADGQALAVWSPEFRTELQLEFNGERFERFVARVRCDGALLGAGVTLAAPEFWVVSGDDAGEVWRLEFGD